MIIFRKFYCRLNFVKNFKFCQEIKLTDLNTYPQVLTDKEIFDSIKKVIDTPDQIFVKQLQQNIFDESLFKEIKKKIKFVPNPSLLTILKQASSSSKEDKLWTTLEDELSKRLKSLTLDQISELVWNFAYANRSNRQFFKNIENELFDRELEFIDVKNLNKLLWGFSHCNKGSVLLYKKLSDTIKIAQQVILLQFFLRLYIQNKLFIFLMNFS